MDRKQVLTILCKQTKIINKRLESPIYLLLQLKSIFLVHNQPILADFIIRTSGLHCEKYKTRVT
jgi:hypothetical protein